MARKKAAASAKSSPAKAAKADTVFCLKITLDWLKPDVWRRVEVPDCTLWELHAVIQLCMPWTDSHMWSFEVGRDEQYSLQADRELGFRPADRVKLSQLAARDVKKIRYTYDFGDSWDHIIVFEKPVARDPKAKYPRCVAGARACPPDDCGGPPGYEQLLEVLADPKHRDHEDMIEWAGGPIDPEAFDLGETNKSLQRLKLK
jgi:hypothetical protein